MQNSTLLFLITAPLFGACASFPAPTQRLADAQSAERSAREVARFERGSLMMVGDLSSREGGPLPGHPPQHRGGPVRVRIVRRLHPLDPSGRRVSAGCPP